jgi:hypothetical protein
VPSLAGKLGPQAIGQAVSGKLPQRMAIGGQEKRPGLLAGTAIRSNAEGFGSAKGRNRRARIDQD